MRTQKPMFKHLSNSVLLLLLAITLFLGVLLSNTYLRGLAVDLTEQKVYSLSNGTNTILQDLAEPIDLVFFFSDDSSSGLSAIRDYAARVEGLLGEYARKSDGKISLEVVDPKPFSEAEDRAASFGLTAAGSGFAQDAVYFGLAGTNSRGESMVIGFFDPQKESFLEYDISSLIYQLSQARAPKLTILSDLPLAGGQDPISRRITPAVVVYQQLQEFFEVSLVSTSVSSIPEDTELLLVLHPQNINQELLFSIDQFLMREGRALVLVDPHYESDAMAQMGSMGANTSSLALLEHYGINVDTEQVVLDAQTGLEVRSAGNEIIRHLGYLGLGTAQINSDDITSADLETINGASFGIIKQSEGSSLAQTVLLSSSENSGLVGNELYSKTVDPKLLQTEFNNEAQSFVLAARYVGRIESYFVGQDISAIFAQQSEQITPEQESPDLVENDLIESDLIKDDVSEDPQQQDASLSGIDSDVDVASELVDADHTSIIEVNDNAALVVIADVDIASDRFWVQQSNFFGQNVFTPFANNGDFIINVLENLSGSQGLIGIRSRGTFARPFTRVQDIQVAAEQKFRDQEQRLQQQLEQTEAQLAELQNQSDSATISAAQQKAIDEFTSQRIEIRKSLRDVQFQLQKDIDELGTQLKWLNIVVAPIILSLLLLLVSRLFRRKAPKHAA